MHFGKIVKEITANYNLSAADVAWLMNRTEEEILHLFEAEEWTSGNIKAASEALNYDFGTYLNRGVDYDFMRGATNAPYHDLLINIKYPIGKENQFEAWVERMWLTAQNIGLQSPLN